MVHEKASQVKSYPTLSAAVSRAYHALGFNVIALDGQKTPLTKWKSNPDWTTNRQTVNDLNNMPWRKARRIAAICGAVSGDLRCVDFDKQPDRAVVDMFLAALNLPPDYQWVEQSPRGGYHVWLICHDLTPPDDARGGKIDRAGRLAGHIELRFEGVLTTLYFESIPDEPPATADSARLFAAYNLVTASPLPRPAPERAPYTAPTLPHDANELEEVERRTRAAIANALIKRGGRPGYYACPLEHGRDGKDFLFNPEPGQPIGGCQGKHAGQLTRWVDLAELLVIDVSQIARDVAAERRPFARPAATAITVTRFPYGFPYTLRTRILNAHYQLKGRVNAQRPAVLVWEVWQELGDIFPDAQPVTAKQVQAASAAIGRNVSEDAAETGLAMLAAWGVTEIRHKCDLPTQENLSSKVAKVPNLPKRTRPAKYYQFMPIDQQVANVARHYTYLERESAFAGVPSDVQPEYGDLAEDDLGLFDDLRAPVYEQYAAERESAQATLDRGVGMLESAVERILQGRYRPVTLPPGPIPNAPALMRALHKADLEAAGGEREKAYKEQFVLGVSRSTLSRIRTANGAITVAREGQIPAGHVTDYQRDHGLVLAEHDDGTVTVKLASAEKFADMANEDERQAYEDLCQRQRETRARAKGKEKSQVETKPRPPLPDTIPQAYSDQHVLEQFEFTPGAESIPRFDAKTGEVYTPGQLWRLLADRLVAPSVINGEVDSLPTLPAEEQSSAEARTDEMSGGAAPAIITLPNGERGFYLSSGRWWRLCDGPPADRKDPRK